MRNAFAKEMTEIAGNDDKLVLLSGDIGNMLFDNYKKVAPERFFNCGVAEANMMGLASGMAMSGLRPFVYTITPFTTTRVMEQIRVDVCYQNVPVVICGVGSGLSYASLGATHHSCEDIAMLRTLPNMNILCPGDAMEVHACIRAAYAHDGPSYIRLGKKGEPVIHDEIPDLTIGQPLTIRDGKDVSILSVGTMLPTAMEASDILLKSGINAGVTSFHTVKPLNTDTLARAFDTCRLVVTLEEHSLIGGLGSAIAEWVVDQGGITTPLLRIGTPDKFFSEAGEQEYARERLGLDPASVAKTITAKLN
ncbi:MAG: transketolase [Rhodospirillales bacterium]|jgi:transketolase|nr:transketolase [Rhodospirillales bacterium]MBT4006502.1 transketolase [Rhodospirillales bacterium]MBT5075904.1 transketolase [Rhodospirillales bacterium]MBT5113780.1 transketolase [Rhodospirillales bacterium]MBT5672308.1 transketolase [Rhodospirillales bacterium]